MHHPSADHKKDSPSGSGGSGDKTATDKTHSTDSRSESDLSDGTGQQRAPKAKKRIENNFACTSPSPRVPSHAIPLPRHVLPILTPGGDLEKETWKAAAALRSHVGSLWRSHLSARAGKMRAAHCGLPEREGTAYDSYYSGMMRITFPSSPAHPFPGKEVVDYLLEESGSKDRPKEVEFAQNLISEGFICHIYFSGVFRDAPDFVIFIRVRRCINLLCCLTVPRKDP